MVSKTVNIQLYFSICRCWNLGSTVVQYLHFSHKCTCATSVYLFTFCTSHRRCKMYSVCLSLAAFPHYCMDLDVTWGNGRRCPVVVHCWVDLRSVHEFRYYDNTMPNTKCQRVLVLALCLVAQKLVHWVKKCHYTSPTTSPNAVRFSKFTMKLISKFVDKVIVKDFTTTTKPQPFYSPFSGTTRVS